MFHYVLPRFLVKNSSMHMVMGILPPKAQNSGLYHLQARWNIWGRQGFVPTNFFQKCLLPLIPFFGEKCVCSFFMTLIAIRIIVPTKFMTFPLGLIYEKRPWGGFRRGTFLLMCTIQIRCAVLP